MLSTYGYQITFNRMWDPKKGLFCNWRSGDDYWQVNLSWAFCCGWGSPHSRQMEGDWVWGGHFLGLPLPQPGMTCSAEGEKCAGAGKGSRMGNAEQGEREREAANWTGEAEEVGQCKIGWEKDTDGGGTESWSVQTNNNVEGQHNWLSAKAKKGNLPCCWGCTKIWRW